jgi:Membrane-associated sensor, integral membrane domain/Histidine kinase
MVTAADMDPPLIDSPSQVPAVLTLRATVGIIFGYVALVLLLVPIVGYAGPEIPGISTVFVAVVFVAELSTSFLLFVRVRDNPTWSLLMLATAYLYSALMVIPHLLTFPGAVLVGQSLVSTSPQSTGWLFVFWILGYAILTLTSVILETGSIKRTIASPEVVRATVIAIGAITVVVIAFAVTAIRLVDYLPVVVSGSSWTNANRVLIYIALVMFGASIAIIIFVIRRELFFWLALALTAVACANILSELGGARYTVGWSAGRLSWIVSASALFIYFLGQFARQQQLLALAKDILELRVAERTADLKNISGQRDLLLREVHHRVKNNLQVVDSLIHFQTSHLNDPEAKSPFRNSCSPRDTA